jgi:hypothetical protein
MYCTLAESPLGCDSTGHVAFTYSAPLAVWPPNDSERRQLFSWLLLGEVLVGPIRTVHQ